MPSNKDIEKNSKAQTSNKLKLYLRNRKNTLFQIPTNILQDITKTRSCGKAVTKISKNSKK